MFMLLFYIVSLMMSVVYCQPPFQCDPGQAVESTQNEIKCVSHSCSSCDVVSAKHTKLFNCGESACVDLNAEITANNNFLMECSGDGACEHTHPGNVIMINCMGKRTKGIKCNGDHACRNTSFLLFGSVEGCDIEKIECDGIEACAGASFEFFGYVTVEEFVCSEEMRSCHNLQCHDNLGLANCPY